MNARIKLLAEQAREFATTRHPVSNIVLSVNSDKFEEKFAELIVRECADILMKPAIMEWDEGLRSELSDYNKGWVNGRLLGIEHIKEHFGVEE